MRLTTDDNMKDTCEPRVNQPWVVLLVDDDEQVHQVTKLALSRFEFKNRGLELITANSAMEARKVLGSRNDIALALIDVVMESEHAGLGLVKYIRHDLKNKMTRIVLRTGQAGKAPEDVVIQEYDIDDYKEKTELTRQKLRTLLYSMLRSYSGLCVIEAQKKGLGKVIQASAHVQNTNTFRAFAKAVLNQMTSLLEIDAPAFYGIVSHDSEGGETGMLTIAATEEYIETYPFVSLAALPPLAAKRCQQALNTNHAKQYPDAYVYRSSNKGKLSGLLYIELSTQLTGLDKQLLDIYVGNIALTFENLSLMNELQETSKEIVFNLANAVEVRSKETGAHVQRVAKCCELLARYYGLSETQVLKIKYASPLHDVGKVAVPDSILHKPGKLNADEWKEMQKHVEYGVEILSKSKRPLLKIAAEIAGTHHEKWDGSGYPKGLSGKDIPISGRITALADVFDALGSPRSYKEAWGDADVKMELLSKKGSHFEPELVDILIGRWDEFLAIRQQHPD